LYTCLKSPSDCSQQLLLHLLLLHLLLLHQLAMAAAAAAVAAAPGATRLRVLVSGASGMVGRALVACLRVPTAANYFRPEVYHLVRRPARAAHEIYWNPYEMRIDMNALEGMDAVVHLAGENVVSGEGLLAFTGRWTPRKQHMVEESRRRGTLLLSQALAATRVKPRVLVSASTVGYYGDGGDAHLTEESRPGAGFLSRVATSWEEGTAPAAKAGIRTVNARFGSILSHSGGILGTYCLVAVVPTAAWLRWP